MGKRPHSSETPVVVQLVVADTELQARLIALLGSDERYTVRWNAPSRGFDDAGIVIADRPVASEAPLLLLTEDPSAAPPHAAAVLPAGADGELLEAAVTLVLAGLVVGPSVRRRTARPATGSRPPAPADGAAPATVELATDEPPLTTREHEVLVLMTEGASNKMIAQRLGISVHTAKFHVGSVLAKLGARSRSDAIAIGLRRGLLLL